MLRCSAATIATASALLPRRCRRRAVRRRPLKLSPPPHRCHAAANVTLTLVDCYISVDSDTFLSPHPAPFLSIHPQITPYFACHTNHNKTLWGGGCVVLANPMDCAQTKRMRHRPWCVDDAYALGWGALTPHATEWAKAAPTPWLR
jgi:hypothetical protein